MNRQMGKTKFKTLHDAREQAIHLRQIAELTKKLNDDFDKKLKELKEQHIQEIKEAVKKARKRQTNQNIALVVESKNKWEVK